MTEERVSPAESLGMFNTFSVEIRSKIDGLVKQILFLSGGIQAITIGAFLSSSPPRFPPQAMELLAFGWLCLSLCIVLCLTFMLGQLSAMISVGFKFKDKIEQARPGSEVFVAPMPLRVFNWVVGLGAFVSCAAGVIALSNAAMALISTSTGA